MEDTRLESFPFESKRAGYNDYGYPVYDRAVGASMLRQTFEQFFSDGVFGTPGDAMRISKGKGLKVSVAEGIAIINGAIASVPEGGLSISLTDETTTIGTYAYGVFLRYDENIDKRSVYIQVRKGNAGPQPSPPDPDTTSPGIRELRLGYVVVPTGSSDLSYATVTNEKGLAVCPFAAPFEEIDVESIVLDFRAAAQQELSEFGAELDGYLSNAGELVQDLVNRLNQYQSLIDSALDDTTAGYLQQQIDALESQLSDFDLSGSVDNSTVVYATAQGDPTPKLRVPDGGITKEKLSFGFDKPDGVASYEAVESVEKSVTLVSGDLAEVLFELHVAQMGQLDLDTIVVFDFPGDVSSYQGQYDSSGVKYYAAPGTGA